MRDQGSGSPGMYPKALWYIAGALLSSVSYSSNGKQTEGILLHVDLCVYVLALKEKKRKEINY